MSQAKCQVIELHMRDEDDDGDDAAGQPNNTTVANTSG